MRRFYSSAIAGAILLFGATSVKADWDYWGIKKHPNAGSYEYYIYTIDSETGTSTLRNTRTFSGSANPVTSSSYVDQNTGELIVELSDSSLTGYNITTDTWSDKGSTWTSGYLNYWKKPTVTGNQDGGYKIEINGEKMIEKKANGELHIGENSWITKEEDGMQKVWAKDSNGNSIPINYTNGTKLLINGRDVEQAIDNVGALSAALTGLPTVPQDSPMACGIGTGTHSNNFAFSGGCASRINEKLAFNVAASFVPGQQYQGNFDSSWSGRAGFVFKLGKVNKPSLISMNDKKALKEEIKTLKVENQEIKSSNQQLKDLVHAQNQRLEKLERIALTNQNEQKTATSFLNLSNLFSTMRSFLISSN